MKNTRLESKTISMPAKPRGIAGLQVRSGVKAGLIGPTGPMPGDGDGFGGGRDGGGGREGHRRPSSIGMRI